MPEPQTYLHRCTGFPLFHTAGSSETMMSRSFSEKTGISLKGIQKNSLLAPEGEQKRGSLHLSFFLKNGLPDSRGRGKLLLQKTGFMIAASLALQGKRCDLAVFPYQSFTIFDAKDIVGRGQYPGKSLHHPGKDRKVARALCLWKASFPPLDSPEELCERAEALLQENGPAP